MKRKKLEAEINALANHSDNVKNGALMVLDWLEDDSLPEQVNDWKDGTITFGVNAGKDWVYVHVANGGLNIDFGTVSFDIPIETINPEIKTERKWREQN